jgi:hypothetical protein
MTSADTLAAWCALVAHAGFWAAGPRWSGGTVHHPPALPPALADAAAELGGIRRIAYRTAAEDRELRARFAAIYRPAPPAERAPAAPAWLTTEDQP